MLLDPVRPEARSSSPSGSGRSVEGGAAPGRTGRRMRRLEVIGVGKPSPANRRKTPGFWANRV